MQKLNVQVVLSCFASHMESKKSTLEPPLLQCVVVERTGTVVLAGPLEACRLNAVASHAPAVTLFTWLQHNDFLMCVCSECTHTVHLLYCEQRRE